MGDKEESAQSGAGDRALRDRPRVDYAHLHTYGAAKYPPNEMRAADDFCGSERVTRDMSRTLLNTGMPPMPDSGDISDLEPGSRSAEQMAREMEEIDREMKSLADQEALLAQSQQLREKRLALQEMRKKVTKLRGMDLQSDNLSQPSRKHVKKNKISSDSKVKLSARPKVKFNSQTGARSVHIEDELSSSESNNEIDINSLRKNKKLRKSVRKELSSLGLHCQELSSSSRSTDSSDKSSSSGTSDTSDDDDSSNQKVKKNKKHRSKKSKKKSGIKAKSSDKVKSPQKWPHAYLQFEYVNKQVTFEELDYRMFIAGELEVISESDISKTERNGRINLLKKIVYYSSTYDFKGLKAFYAAWLREIELGKRSWSDDPQQIETAILTKHIRSQKNSQPVSKKDSSKSSSDKEKVWFCSMYQRNKCPHKNGHMAVFKGEAKLCQHICATCWLKDKTKLTHPECSSSCPHASA